ncbi:MAG: TraR/DksA family transcriptional regulator [Candidatus Binataceae bacterium]
MLEYLTGLRTTLLRDIAAQLRTGRESSRDDCMDSCDLASDENEREISTMLSERDRLKIAQIDDALRRIALLRYGVCETCGLDITGKRLNAMPFAERCCDCQEERERETKTRHRNEEHDYESHDFVRIQGQEQNGRQPMMGSGNESIVD